MKNLGKYSKVLVVLMLMVAVWTSKAQNPTYLCVAKNDTQINSKDYQFDVYIYQTGSVPLYLNNFQMAFKIQNTALIVNGGAITGSFVAGSSELTGFAPTGTNTTFISGQRMLRYNGPAISPLGILVPPEGLKMGTFRISNTVDFGQANMNLAWSNNGPYFTRIFALVGGVPTEITNFPGSHIINFTDPVLNNITTGTGVIGQGGSEHAEELTSPVIKNYPNPFSDKTTVMFILPANDHVKLDVCDLTGKLIQTLYNDNVKQNQEYKVEFDGAKLPTGIYIYKLTTNEDVFTGKMILNKE
jgi:hypothetical protein